ncbi:hypothetical protein AB0957_18325 [Streptomyces zhihengii]|uniref:hypothetical protein n=1 Tax=Streptomyces zhihengii TaxID=1818004 RepID=UPI003455D710
MDQAQTRAERRALNQRRHAEQRQQAQQDRGPRGVAELWWDQARAIARARAEGGDETAWNDLATTLANYCDRYSR